MSTELTTLTSVANRLNLDPNSIYKLVARLKKRNPDTPFPEPVGRKTVGGHDLYDYNAALEYLIQHHAPVRYQQLTQKFIRGEFDRPELKRLYLQKRQMARQSRRAA